MIKQLHTPQGIIEVDFSNVTDEVLAELGMTRGEFNTMFAEQLAEGAERKRINDLLHKEHSLTPVKDLREVVRYLAKREGLL